MAHKGFSGDGFRAFRENDRPGPIHMINLVRLHDRAVYDDGRDVSGAAAYAAYGQGAAPVLERVGGRIVWRGAMEFMLIGPAEEQWDICFIAAYPSVEAFVTMIKDPDYRAAMLHRQAAVADSRLIRTAPLSLGDNFAG
jgi:uncharacterized protein (DUF1330 family)